MRAVVVLLLLAAACNRIEPEAGSPISYGPIVRPMRWQAAALLAGYECNRCHEVPDVAPPPRDKQCFGCHQQIHAGTFEAAAPALTKWRDRITSLREAPSLVHADRLRRSWVENYLLHPHDLRPGSVAQMPRLPIGPADAHTLAMFLVPEDAAEPIATGVADEVRGRQLFGSLACARCHRFSGARVDDAIAHAAGANQLAPLDAAWRLAPDLRHARDRMQPHRLASQIANPQGAMPNLGVGEAEARALAAYISTTPLGGPEPKPHHVRTIADVYADVHHEGTGRLDREVTWGEVEQAVFRDTCWHCHAVPDFARGDGGPGNTGGFGFRPRGLDLSSYSGISTGSLDDAGERRSIFAPFSDPDRTPRLVVQLLARHVEEAGFEVPGVTGMPLGLPALSFDKIRLVATWIAQGRPN